MLDPKACGMQGLPLESLQGGDEAWACAGRKAGAAAIDGVADQGVADVGHVHTNLVGPAGFKVDLDQGVRRKAFLDAVMGDRGFTIAPYRKALAVCAMPADRQINGAAAGERALDQCQILAMHAVSLELFHQDLVGLDGSRHHQEPAGVLVNAVDDPGSWDLDELGRMMQQGILKRAIMVTGRRMNHQSLGLVHDDDGFILVEDRQGNRFGCNGCDRFESRCQVDGLPAKDLLLRLGRFAVDPDGAFPDPVLNPVAGIFGKQLAQGLIKTFSGKGQRNLASEVRWGIHFSP